ncbi:hypothetical protein SPSE_1458 [Staphylococcus pseudintermedius ED99]|nr:hypothetical protein SPSE_1458 [Staphylococcus pseudintermedius ED99]
MRYHHVVCMLIDMDKWLFRYLRKINDNVYTFCHYNKSSFLISTI